MNKFNYRSDIIKFVPDGGVFAELGVMKGEFTSTYIHEAIKRNIEVHLVDIWSPENNAEVYNNWNDKIFNDWYSFVYNNYGKFPNVKMFRMSTLVYLASIPDNSLDCVYIDADHTYKGVYRDIDASIPKVKNGGFISGHDYPPYPKDHFKNNGYEFGIQQAVLSFTSLNDIEITGESEPYYKSWKFKNNKTQ